MSWLKDVRVVAGFYLHHLYRQLGEKNLFLWAQAIAFKVLVALVPMVILATGLLGQVLRRSQPFASVAAFVRGFLPEYQSTQVIAFLDRFQQASGALTLIGLLGLFVTAISLFTTLRVVLANVFNEDWHQPRPFLTGYLFDLQMTLQTGLLFVLSMATSVLVQTLNVAGMTFLRQVGVDNLWLEQGWRHLFQALGLALPFLLSMVMFFQLYFLIPRPRPPRRSALLGAVFAALLWELAKVAFTFYATRVGGFERYSGGVASDGLAALGDTFGLIVALMFWAYYSGLVLILGALLTLLHELKRRNAPVPARITRPPPYPTVLPLPPESYADTPRADDPPAS
jgi:membrane protein